METQANNSLFIQTQQKQKHKTQQGMQQVESNHGLLNAHQLPVGLNWPANRKKIDHASKLGEETERRKSLLH